MNIRTEGIGMSKQRTLHEKVIKKLSDLETLIDQLKAAGPDELDGYNALLNTRERLEGLSQRAGF